MKQKLTLLIAAITMLTSCGNKSNNQDGSLRNELPVRVEKIAFKEGQQHMRISGRLTTNDETYLSFKTGGVIAKIFVNEGDAVIKGQLLAKLNLTEVAAGVSQAQIAFEKAQRDYTRLQKLYADSVITLEQLQNAKTGLDIAKEQLNGAKFNQTYSEIRAISNGTILKKLANEGQIVGQGTPVFQTNGSMQKPWILKAGISDSAWGELTIGDKAVISTDAYPNKEFTGRVTAKATGIDPYNGTLSVEITVDGTNLPFASGMYASATLKSSKRQQVAIIPFDALLESQVSSGFVFVTSDRKKARMVKVQIEAIQNDSVWVSSGISTSDELIVSGSAYLKNGSTIKIVK